jgi:hypothetical protein
MMDRIAQAIFYCALIFLRTHIDEIDNDEATQVTNSQLATDFVGGFEVGIERSRFNIAAFGRPSGVDIDRYQRLGVIDNDAAARR